MKTLFKLLVLALCLSVLAAPAAAQVKSRAYAPEDLRELSREDQSRVIGLEYQEQSGGRRIPDDQLRFYLDQVNRSDWTFSRIKDDIARSLGGDYDPGPGPAPGTGQAIRCESTEGRSRTCPTPWRGRSTLSRQFSGTNCIEGRNWSSQSGQVSVWGGCRAEFVADRHASGPDWGSGGGSVRCDSNEGRSRTCPTPWQGRSQVSRQISGTPCEEGRNWSSQRGEVTVWGGCRAEFSQAYSGGPGMGETIRCESSSGRSRTCPTPWNGRSRVVRQLSETNCTEGRTWTAQRGEVTVWGGCRAEFASARDGWNGGGGGGYSVTCASRDDRYSTCHWAPGQGQPRLLQQLSSEPCVRGSSWGMADANTLWVSRGCRARFGN